MIINIQGVLFICWLFIKEMIVLGVVAAALFLNQLSLDGYQFWCYVLFPTLKTNVRFIFQLRLQGSFAYKLSSFKIVLT